MHIDKNEVLRYLGHNGQSMDETLSELIDTCIEEVSCLAKPLYVYKIFETEAREDRVLFRENAFVLEGKDIAAHLKDAGRSALMAVTLGADMDKRIRYLEVNQMTKALIMDACATAAVESVCDRVEAEIRELARKDGFAINFRYSPGYGDLPLAAQPGILTLLNAQKQIGLTCTDSFIMLPRKSVTAIIGLIPPEKQAAAKTTESKSCRNCSKYNDCLYRRRVGTCSEH